ncbi:hypothetical protein EZJ43_05625 [Pedobacter changchengzhani]|uniref:Uncharacterized protein n=1 Tax=Pedobacter changchengzhani TaxID=2529274 RepID=A0A4R5MN88_9SPHI|nr:hypothetical protein [Pedobacter changchengzhani]TDG36765.1 hypothetical protein EZJ43_05625 [Pedobacter changchengzhani]
MRIKCYFWIHSYQHKTPKNSLTSMMKQQDIFKKVGNILTELNEQYQYLAQNPQQLNDLEVELFLANAHFLTDHVEIVKKLNALHPEVKNDFSNIVIEPTEEKLLIEELEPTVEFELDEPADLEEIAQAEEAEQRVDIVHEQEVVDEEKIHVETAEKVLEYDFFKPDNDENTFTFDLGKSLNTEVDKFDYEEKPVEEIFDRQFTNEEEDILAKKKNALNQTTAIEAITEKPEPFIEDEIGPEPFLIHTEEPEVLAKEEKIVHEPVVVASHNPKYDDDIISPPVREEVPIFIPNAVPVKPVVESHTASVSPSFNDLLARSNAQPSDVKPTIGDLKQGINLNEKLLFIKDLFGGYNLAYSEAIDLINKMTDFETADNFLQSNYAVKNNWANKQATVDQFYELLNRRFRN